MTVRNVNALDLLRLQIGDVVAVEADDPMKGGGIGKSYVERWLEGGLALWEGSSIVGAVFFAPEGLEAKAVAVFPMPRTEIGWLSPVSVEILGEPPTALELENVVMQRKRRLFVHVERLGKGAPRIEGSAAFAEYRAAGRAMGVVLRAHGMTLAWSGLRYDDGEYEKWGKAS